MAYKCHPNSISALTSTVNEEPGLSAWVFSRSSDQTTGVCAARIAAAEINAAALTARLTAFAEASAVGRSLARRPKPRATLPAYKAATLHDHGHLANRADRLRRVALHGDQV